MQGSVVGNCSFIITGSVNAGNICLPDFIVQQKANHFFLPPQSQPFIMPVIPPAAAFWVCNLSSIDGNSTRLRATSKNSGLHGTGSKLGGNWVKFGLFVVTFGSSVYSSNRSQRGCKVNDAASHMEHGKVISSPK